MKHFGRRRPRALTGGEAPPQPPAVLLTPRKRATKSVREACPVNNSSVLRAPSRVIGLTDKPTPLRRRYRPFDGMPNMLCRVCRVNHDYYRFTSLVCYRAFFFAHSFYLFCVVLLFGCESRKIAFTYNGANVSIINFADNNRTHVV